MTLKPNFEDHREHLRRLVEAVLRRADAGAALRHSWVEPGAPRVYLLAIGKASVAMARAAADLLGNRLVRGIVTAPAGGASAEGLPGVLRVFEVDHPLPTARNVAVAAEIERELREFARTGAADGAVVALLSGGGSAHLAAPAGGVQLADLRRVSEALMRAGAPIGAINAVRKHTERLKGGRLARLAQGCEIDVFVLSDVIGDPIDVISSGPFAPDPTTFADAAAAIAQYGATGVSPAVDDLLKSGGEETPKPGDEAFAKVRHRVIANNVSAVIAAVNELAALGFRCERVRSSVEGEAARAGRELVQLAASADTAGGAACVVMGGEPTVRVGAATGTGGPSQELALAAAIELERSERAGRSIAVVAFSTDGIDGPTEAAGAVVTHDTARVIRSQGREPGEALLSHDSSGALALAGALLKTGPTGTNVNHVCAALVYPARG